MILKRDRYASLRSLPSSMYSLSTIASSSSSPSLSPISCSSLIPHPYPYILGRSFYPLDLPLCHSTTTLLFPFSLYSGRAHIVQWTTL